MSSQRATLVCVATGLLAAYAAVFGVPVQDEPAVRPQPRYVSPSPQSQSQSQSQQQQQQQQHPQGTAAPQGEEVINAQRPSIAARAAKTLFTGTHSGFHSTVFYDASVCAGHVDIRRASADECKTKDGVPFSTDAGLSSWIRHTFGPDFVKVMLRGPEVVLANVTYGGGCAYRADFFLATQGTYELRGELVFEQYSAVNELVEKTWYDYAQRSLFPTGAQQKPPALTCAAPHPFFSSPERLRPCARDAGSAATQSQQWGRWVSTGESDANFKKKFPHYWLSFTGEPPLDDQTPDILGRMDFGTKYQWKPYGCRHTAYPQADALEALRNTTLFFFGDSHLRTTFYGALERLGVEFKRNKIWKGDRTDYIKSHNVTIGYIASYFLNMSRPTAAEMLAKDAIVLAGVGQHHASSCYAVRKHVSVVEVRL